MHLSLLSPRNLLRLAAVASLLFTMQCNQLMDLLDPKSKVDTDTATSAPSANLIDTAGSWTILVYLDADNNLEGAGVGDVNEMMQAGALSGNKTYVLMDRINTYDNSNTNTGLPAAGTFFGTVLFSVIDGTISLLAPTTQSVPYTGNPNWPTGTSGGVGDEVNMGDRKTLENFIIFGLKQAIADGSDYVYLDIWDHGAGWGGGAYGGNAVAWDDSNSHDALSIDEIRTAITNAYAAVPNKKITIIGFDACYMGTMENAYSFKDTAKIMIGSEEVEPGAGWDYKNWLPKGKTTPRAVATSVVSSYKNYYNGGSEQVTLAAYDLAKISGVSSSMESFLGKISSQQPTAISNARVSAQSYNNDLSVDLISFLSKIDLPESTALRNAVTAMMIAETHTTGGKVGGSNGVTIYFPVTKDNYDTTYNTTVIATETRWDDFIAGKIASFEVSSTEPGDATCGSESNDTASKANVFSSARTCTGYIYTPSDVDIYRFSASVLNGTGTIDITMSNIPSGADFDVLLFNTDVSPSAPIAAGVIGSGNGNESFSFNPTNGVVTYPLAGITCNPSVSSTYVNQGLCYGQGISVTGNTSSNFFIVVTGKNSSYSQVGQYTLKLSLSTGATITIP